MSVQRYFIKENALRAAVHEFLSKELERAGYSKVELMKTPLGVRVVVYAARPGMVIGRRGQSIKELTRLLEERFGLENPQISVAEIEAPELDPAVMAAQIASALEKGVHFRRAAYWALRRIMEAGALGADIKISGKLTTERARYEKYSEGYLPKAGDPVLKQMREATHYTQLKPGLFGIKVRILPPNVEFPDRVIPKEGPGPEGVARPAEAGAGGESEGEEVEDRIADSEDE
ncbi:MAG: 30S ribosomal protein S3 [Candidatus Bathyarchaeia archaeon]